MRAFTAVVERCHDTGYDVGYVHGIAGARSQGEPLDELQRNLREDVEMLLEDGEPALDTEFVGTQSITVAAESMFKPPVPKPREVCRILQFLDFVLARERVFHMQSRRSDGRCTTVPYHPGRDLSPVLLRRIVTDIEMKMEDSIAMPMSVRSSFPLTFRGQPGL